MLMGRREEFKMRKCRIRVGEVQVEEVQSAK
jgi:hypothetical protein